MAGASAFNQILFESNGYQLLPPGLERSLAEQTIPGEPDLYEWSDGQLRLVNVEGEGAGLRLVNRCGASLGAGGDLAAGQGTGTVGAVSGDGSRIFFTTPALERPGCEEPTRLYIRIDGKETVEVSRPGPGVKVKVSEREPVFYNGASKDGSRVFFSTETPLLAGETTGTDRLFMYDTETGVLSLVTANFVSREGGTGGGLFLVSQDGLTVYYTYNENIFRYDTYTGTTSFVAAIHTPIFLGEFFYTTPNGEFLLIRRRPWWSCRIHGFSWP